MNIIRNWFLKRGLRKHKERALFEARQDLKYLKAFKGDMLNYDESKARVRMGELKRKEERTNEEQAEYEQVLGIIALSKSVKNEFEKTEALIKDLKEYLSII